MLQGVFQFTFRHHELSLSLSRRPLYRIYRHTILRLIPRLVPRAFTSVTFIGNGGNSGDPCFSDTAVREFLSRRTLVRYCRKLKENTIHPAERDLRTECRESALARKVDRFAWRENNSIFRRYSRCSAMQIKHGATLEVDSSNLLNSTW